MITQPGMPFPLQYWLNKDRLYEKLVHTKARPEISAAILHRL